MSAIVVEFAVTDMIDMIMNPIISEIEIIAVTWALTLTTLLFSSCISLLCESARTLFLSGLICLKMIIEIH